MQLIESAVPGFEEVSGVGDHALIHAMISRFGHEFYLRKGDALITIPCWCRTLAGVGGGLGRKIISNL